MGPRYAALTSTIPVEPFSPPFHISFHRSSFQGLPLIEELFPLCQPQLHLDFPVGEVKAKRDESKPPLLNLSDEAPNLSTVEEKFPRPQWIMVKSISMGIGADMSIYKKELSIFNLPITVPYIALPLPKGFHLCSQKGDPSLKGIFNRIVITSLSILTDQFLSH